jgi:hypothetical protein
MASLCYAFNTDGHFISKGLEESPLLINFQLFSKVYSNNVKTYNIRTSKCIVEGLPLHFKLEQKQIHNAASVNG